MSGHVPPPGAENEVDRLAEEYLARVQEVIKTSHKPSVLLIGIGGLMRVAVKFKLSAIEINDALLKAMRRGR